MTPKEALTKQSPILTLAEAARFLKFSEGWVKKQVREKKIPQLKFGRQVRFYVADLEKFALEHRENVGVSQLVTVSDGRGWLYQLHDNTEGGPQ